MTAINPEVEELIADIESTFDGVQADAHVYVSPRARSSGYQVHRDTPQHKIYLQVLGTTEWTVYRGSDPRRGMPVEEAERLLAVDFRAKMTPGSILYMPPNVFHRAENPYGPRISLSIPFNRVPGSLQVDREHISIAQALRATAAEPVT
jgi:ribosomal protein L16 Arg81 hydroxylase